MRELIESALKSHDADYLEVRLEEAESTILRYRGRDLEEVGRSAGMGGCVRAAVRGGWGFVSFNDLSDLPEKVAQAVRQARLVGAGETLLADVEPVVDVVEPAFPADPRLVPLAEKKRVLDEYVELLWGGPAIQTSSLGYADGYRSVSTTATASARTRSAPAPTSTSERSPWPATAATSSRRASAWAASATSASCRECTTK